MTITEISSSLLTDEPLLFFSAPSGILNFIPFEEKLLKLSGT